MITVVHAITQLELGGAQENTLYTVRHLDRRQFRVALIFGPGGMLDEEARTIPDAWIEPVPSLVRALSPIDDPVGFYKLVRLFRRFRGEHERDGHRDEDLIVHTHSSKAGILGRLAAKAAGVKRIVHTIHGFGFHPGQSAPVFKAFEAAERSAALVTNAFVSVSRANLAEASARGILAPHHLTRVIRSGMNLEELFHAHERRSDARAQLGLAPDDEVIVSIGNFKPQKDPATLIAAMVRLSSERPKAKLLIAGDGELRPMVERAMRTAGLGDRVRLLGWHRDIPGLLAAADVVTLASIFEGLPKSAVQAIAAGRPFVGTRVDGTGEIIREGRNGYLVEPRDPAALAAGLLKALTLRPVDPSDRLRLAEWDERHMVESLESLYRTMTVGEKKR